MTNNNKTYLSDYCAKQFDQINNLAKKIGHDDSLPDFVNINNGVILPRKTGVKNAPYQGGGGVLDNSLNLVKESVIFDLINSDDQKQLLAFGCAYSVPHIKEDSRKVIYLGLAHQHWGHFLIDIVQRLWFINENEADVNSGKLKDYYFAFAGFGNGVTEFKGNFAEFFRLFRVDASRIIIVAEPTRFSEIIVPDIAIYPGQYIHTVFTDIFRRVIGRAMIEAEKKSLPKYKRIYFSRAHLKDNKEMGEENIQKALEQSGYNVLYPEELSLVEQIWYWQTADEIACVNGSITHNCVFARPELKLYVFNKMSRVVGYQFTMDATWGGTPIYISAYREPFKSFPISVSRGPFWITVTDDVRRFLNDTYDVSPSVEEKRFGFLRYLCLCLLASTKYCLRGSKAKMKLLMRKLK